MNAIQTTVKNRQVVIDVPADWPEGCQVVIEPLLTTPSLGGMSEEDWPTTPEGIAALLQRWDELEPLEMTPQEQVEWETLRQHEKDQEKANFFKNAELWVKPRQNREA